MSIKPQDILFFIIVIGLFYFRKPKLFAILGLLFFLAAIPLFSFWVFFTAQRFIWYGALLLIISIGFNLTLVIKNNDDLKFKKKKAKVSSSVLRKLRYIGKK